MLIWKMIDIRMNDHVIDSEGNQVSRTSLLMGYIRRLHTILNIMIPLERRIEIYKIHRRLYKKHYRDYLYYYYYGRRFRPRDFIPTEQTVPIYSNTIQDIVNDIDDDQSFAEECSICLGGIHPETRRELACTHTFHSECINDWMNRGSTCPMCRTQIVLSFGRRRKRSQRRCCR